MNATAKSRFSSTEALEALARGEDPQVVARNYHTSVGCLRQMLAPAIDRMELEVLKLLGEETASLETHIARQKDLRRAKSARRQTATPAQLPKSPTENLSSDQALQKLRDAGRMFRLGAQTEAAFRRLLNMSRDGALKPDLLLRVQLALMKWGSEMRNPKKPIRSADAAEILSVAAEAQAEIDARTQARIDRALELLAEKERDENAS